MLISVTTNFVILVARVHFHLKKLKDPIYVYKCLHTITIVHVHIVITTTTYVRITKQSKYII